MRLLLVTVVLVAGPSLVYAQPPPTITWRVSAGQDEFRYRDFGDSPVEWRGAGPLLDVEMTRGREQSEHRFGLALSTPRDFVYETGAGEVPRPAGESATFVGGGYAYRRYFGLRILRVLRAGIGVDGAGEHRALHHQPGGADVTESDTTASVVGVVALRFRGGRVAAATEWGNAATLMHARQRLVSDGTYEVTAWGGGWYSDLSARAQITMTARAALFVSYGWRGDDTQAHLQSYNDSHRRVTVGVAYVR